MKEVDTDGRMMYGMGGVCVWDNIMKINHSLKNGMDDFTLKEEDLPYAVVLYSEADDEEMVEIGEGLSFFAKLLRIYCPFGFGTPSSRFSLFS